MILVKKWNYLPLIFPLALSVLTFGQLTIAAQGELWDLPFQSEILKSIYQKEKKSVEKCQNSAPIEQIAQNSKNVSSLQYFVNAQVYIVEKIIQGLKYSTEKIQLNSQSFRDSFFPFTAKYCSRKFLDVTLGDRLRQLWISDHMKPMTAPLTDSWVVSKFNLIDQQKYYTQMTVRLLDSLRDLCQWDPTSLTNTQLNWSLLHYYLADPSIALGIEQDFINQSKDKIFCSSGNECRQLSHQDWIEHFPLSKDAATVDEELQNLWCHQIYLSPYQFQDIPRKNLQPLRPLNKSVSSANKLFVRDLFTGVSDYFTLSNYSSNAALSFFHQIKKQVDEKVVDIYPVLASRVEWETPLQVEVRTPVHVTSTQKEFFQDETFWQVEVISRLGEQDFAIPTWDKLLVKDELHFERSYLEWMLRQSVNINYADSTMYRRKMNELKKHLSLKVEGYLSSRKSVMKIWSYDSSASWQLVDWIMQQRAIILELLKNNPKQQVFSLVLNYWTSFEVLQFLSQKS